MQNGDHASWTVFESHLGWVAMCGRGWTLLELTFGHKTPAAAQRALKSDFVMHESDWNSALAERVQAYAAGAPDDFCDVPLDLSELTRFQQKVVEHCRTIPYGETRTYGELAAESGYPGAARAVGNVMAGNPTPLVVPCHRVLHAGGGLGGYSARGGTRTKLRLLEAEAQAAGV